MREPRSHPGVFLGMPNSSSEAVVVTEQDLAIKTRAANVRIIPESEGWDADRMLGMQSVPCSSDGSDNAFAHSGWRDPLRLCFALLEKC